MNNVLTSIKTISNNQYLNKVGNWFYLSSSDSSMNAGGYAAFSGTNKIYMSYPGKKGAVYVRAVMLKQ